MRFTFRCAIACASFRCDRSFFATTIRPGGVAIEPVHQARTAGASLAQLGAARHQRVDQRVVPVTRRRVHHEAGRLVDDEQVLVLVDDGEGNVGGKEVARRFDGGQLDDHFLTMLEQPRGAHHHTGHAHAAGRDDAGGLRA